MQIDLDTLRHFFSLAPFLVDLGVEAVGVAPGEVQSRLVLQPRHLQHTGQAHAGVLATLADHSMGAAAQTMAPEGLWVVTAELKTSLLRPARGPELICEAVVLKPGRSLSFTEAMVWSVEATGQRTLVMKASATMAMVPQSA